MARLIATVPVEVKRAFERHFPGEEGSAEITRQLQQLLASRNPRAERARMARDLAASHLRRGKPANRG
jgi:hypothetical protein